jgi:hypothetical protein
MPLPSKQKLPWTGVLTFVQPRIRLPRSFDERAHSYLGYVLGVSSDPDAPEDEFVVAIGKAAQAKHEFRRGDLVSGEGVPVADERLEVADLFKASKLLVISRASSPASIGPPWHGTPPPLDVYRQRGHRRLDAKTYAAKCSACIWGCKMAVEITVDHWNPGRPRYRTETFCYGPLSCPLYRAGPKRTVPGRNGMKHVEEDWVDADATSHRGPDE